MVALATAVEIAAASAIAAAASAIVVARAIAVEGSVIEVDQHPSTTVRVVIV